MNRWQCIARYNLIDTQWFHYVYLIIFILLFVHKQRLIAILFAIIMMCLTFSLITGCMSSIAAFTTIALTHCVVITSSVIILFILSFFNFRNIYITYGVSALAIYLLIVRGLLFQLIDYFFPSPVQIVSIGDVNVLNKSREEINQLMRKTLVKVN